MTGGGDGSAAGGGDAAGGERGAAGGAAAGDGVAGSGRGCFFLRFVSGRGKITGATPASFALARVNTPIKCRK